jgi:hypothetical protein
MEETAEQGAGVGLTGSGQSGLRTVGPAPGYEATGATGLTFVFEPVVMPALAD